NLPTTDNNTMTSPPVASVESQSISDAQIGIIAVVIIIVAIVIAAFLLVMFVLIILSRRKKSKSKPDQLYARAIPMHSGAYAQNDITNNIRLKTNQYDSASCTHNPMFNECIDATLKKKHNPPERKFELSASDQNICKRTSKSTESIPEQNRPDSIFKNPGVDIDDDNKSEAST
ncbi:hypothetical protein, partial [Salmonella sp. s51228]|uniref:hypothetical protein n=1 Tax=Salmonella sp. s51228 TaxID=3159652 RepID=UPI0039818CED